MTYPLYLEMFDDADDVAKNFRETEYNYVTRDYDVIKDVDLTDCQILLAYYNYEDYSGNAFVLFQKCGTLYEVNGSHCSCYGLEGQWDPEETTVRELRARINNGYLGTEYTWEGNGRKNVFADELKSVLDALELEGFV